MKELRHLMFVCGAIAFFLVDVGAAAAINPQIEHDDPALDAIVPQDAPLEKVATGFGFTEGPVWTHFGELFFVDINAAKVYKLDTSGKAALLLGPDQFTEHSSTGGVPGANGLTLDWQGRLTICDQGHRVISRHESNGKLTVLADRFQGRRLNSPNDLVYKKDGALYFTDPPYGLYKEDKDPRKELSLNGVYRLKAGKVTLLIKELTRPNGLAFSPDEKYLYVDNSEPQKLYLRYPVNQDGTLGPGTVIYDATGSTEQGVPDGMKIDQKGNIYAAGPGGVLILSPNGKHLGTIRVPEIAANCAWGEKKGSTLYIAATSSIYRIRLSIPGIRP